MESTADQINTLSSGTITSITGIKEYEEIEKIRSEWWSWANYRELTIWWQDAWNQYAEERRNFYAECIEKSRNLIEVFSREMEKPLLTQAERDNLQRLINHRRGRIESLQQRLAIFEYVQQKVRDNGRP